MEEEETQWMLEPPRPGVLFSGGKDSLPGQRREDRGRPPGSGGKNYGVGVGRTPFPDQPRGSRPLAGFQGRWIFPAPKEPGVEEERPPGGTRR